MQQSNRSDSKVTVMDSVELKTLSPSLETFSSSLKTSLSLGTLHQDIILCIFRRLNMCHIVAMVMVCRYFKSIWESVPEPDVTIYPIVPQYVILPECVDVDWQLLHGFEYPLKYIFQCLKLQSLSEFKLVVPEGKTGSSLKYPTKALLVHHINLGDNESQLLESIIFQHPQISILFWGKNPSLISTPSKFYSSLLKLGPLKYLCINDGMLYVDWPNFFNQFKRLKLVYFTPKELDYSEQFWTINTRKTVFIMNFVSIKPFSGNIK
jgi:hypothetical protein